MSTEHLKTIEQRLLWLSHWMIHHANHIRPKADGIKVGGHQASSASMVSIMTALYFSVLRPEDRVAVKPHASPIFHAIQYLMGNQTREPEGRRFKSCSRNQIKNPISNPGGVFCGLLATWIIWRGNSPKILAGSRHPHTLITGRCFESPSVRDHHDQALANWWLMGSDGTERMQGTSYAQIAEDGRFAAFTGFF
ncbi:hypothetical protein LAB1_22260 [Roseibium sp. LAB1]